MPSHSHLLKEVPSLGPPPPPAKPSLTSPLHTKLLDKAVHILHPYFVISHSLCNLCNWLLPLALKLVTVLSWWFLKQEIHIFNVYCIPRLCPLSTLPARVREKDNHGALCLPVDVLYVGYLWFTLVNIPTLQHQYLSPGLIQVKAGLPL